jgi:pilus assembly protein FimV
MSPEHGVGSGLGIAPELEVQPASRAQEWSISAADGRLTSDQHGAEHALAARDPGELMMDQVTGSGPDDRTELVDAEGQGQRSEPSAIAAAAGSNGSEPGQDASRLVDVLAEADVYLTYGRYRDAERVLRETMSAVGETSGLRYKLADTYLAAGDLDALAPLAEKMRVEADSDLDGARWRRIEDALATQAPESALPERETGIDPVDNDEEPLFLDLDELEQVTESRSTQAPPLPSELDQHSAEMGAADRDLDRLQLDLAALNAMTNDPLDHGLPPEGMAQPTASDDLSESMGDAVNPELPTLAGLAEGLAEGPEESAPSPTFEKQPEAQAESDDQRQLLQGQAQTQTQTELDGVADSAETPGGDEDSLDRGPGLGSTDEARDERWPIETGEAWDEVALKLDLARAYLDMEDADAASAILKEVVAEGHDEQRREAEALLAGLN